MLPADGLSRPDVILALIGASLFAAVFATTAFGVPFRVTAPAGSVVGGLAIADGVFRNPPTDG
ncbi:hypothetical protein GRX01_00630 [Halobaculum sp. WSA2]|uniref:Uncharacterized protein n=1 Tax=Halobaculum saliterrae TaxID=2073113 RepID=A0A6B0SLS6_9EURY|nr:hypothetical protein [Halobaculum saliterrae]MXR39868.1 hypothetical protein [Halobaculum saliterrae]